jgi:cell pole-organizing protein PopZ
MEAPAEGFRTIEPAQDLVFDEPAPPEPAAAMEVPEPEEIFAEPEPAAAFHEPPPVSTVDVARRQFERNTGEDRSLLSSTTTAAVDSAFNSLAQTVLVQNSRTLDDLVREMLRPMLKAWLDDNLPNMVERLVRAEIERVSRGRG